AHEGGGEESADILSALDVGTGLAVCWLDDARRVPYYQTGAPLKTILGWWFDRPDRQLLHAGAVGAGEAGVLLAGAGGAGKSTTALLCVDAGLRYAGDDYVLVATEP